MRQCLDKFYAIYYRRNCDEVIWHQNKYIIESMRDELVAINDNEKQWFDNLIKKLQS